MGNGRIRGRRGKRGQTEVADYSWAHSVRAGRHGRVHALVEDLRDRGSDSIHSSARTFLEPEALGRASFPSGYDPRGFDDGRDRPAGRPSAIIRISSAFDIF